MSISIWSLTFSQGTLLYLLLLTYFRVTLILSAFCLLLNDIISWGFRLNIFGLFAVDQDLEVVL